MALFGLVRHTMTGLELGSYVAVEPAVEPATNVQTDGLQAMALAAKQRPQLANSANAQSRYGRYG